jgi:Cu/Ag efflux protein CusF
LTGQIVTQEWLGTSLALSLMVLTACAAYVPPPLTMAHPAHPGAMSAPEPSPSNTLAYDRSALPSTQAAVATAQHAAPAPTSDATAVVGEGKVVAVVPSSNQIVVDHQAINGFMDAMTMGYRVDPPSLLEGFKAGDKIRFTIDLQKHAIVKMEPRQAAGFVGEGNVVAVVPDAQQVVIDHGDIPGYMRAMTMGFRVVSPALLTGLKAGDRVRFTIGAQEKAIVQIEKIGK